MPRHRLARVNEDHRAQVRLLFELLDEQPVGPAKNPPIEIPQFVAGLVGAVLGEFHREPPERGPMDAREESFYDPLGDDLNPAQAGDFRRVEQI